MTEPTTPLMQQYHAIKRQHPHALLLFRLGDFYELFFDDAVTASRELQITLTSRNREKGQAVPMCGVPYHAAENYIARLIRAGHKVAICEQMEDPSRTKKLVRREVIRVLTPGTATGSPLLETRENNYLAAVARNGSSNKVGLAFVDFSTGEFRATEFTGPAAETRLRDELEILRPREVLLPQVTSLFPRAAAPELAGLGATETRLDEWVFESSYSERLLTEQFRVATLDGFGLSGHAQAISAAGGLLHYLRETSAISATDSGNGTASMQLRPAGRGLEHLDRIVFYEQQDALVLDYVTVRNLELVAPSVGDDDSATLLASLDGTATGMGARLLRSWILRPSISLEEISARLDAVAELKSATVVREEIRRDLDQILDLERLTSRVTLGTATPRDLQALRRSLIAIPLLRGFLTRFASARLAALHTQLDDLADVRETIAGAIADDPPAQPTEPGIIRAGYNTELDELRTLSKSSKQIIASMEERERKRTNIGSLKIRFNSVFGYYIEISKANLHLAPPDYERKQTLVNAERFTSPELKDYERKVLDADERILEIERRLYREIRESIAAQASRLRQTSSAIAQLDVLTNFARLAAEQNYSRHAFTESEPGQALHAAGDHAGHQKARGELLIAAGRHPVIETLLETRGERFVPNDLYLDDVAQPILIITGPNMGGKSTYLRQAALIVIMAQIGCFVPAAEARLPLVDRIFTRIGASDNLARGRSTFLVEMSEVAAILNTATPASLVLLDEVGRGTATFDGLSIAWAVVEHLHENARPRTLFATHYHELTELERLLPGVKNVHVSVREAGNEIIFLRRVEPGTADKSYGIEVARLAGLPALVIERAREILAEHEKSEHKLTEELSPGAAPPPQPVMFAAVDKEVLDALRRADLDNLKPLEALNLLDALKKQLS
ncbi:MAG TPA: DNA mismatch repair protein MutS [Candidatus Acidoferrales bacterium]|nr:DNA mismatch repair protein MutS [Candidatus Acidoferrales bacterium]